jgi:hypothetical protein
MRRTDARSRSTRLIVAVMAALGLAVLLVLLLRGGQTGTPTSRLAATGGCPRGLVRESDAGPARVRGQDPDQAGAYPGCARPGHPETYGDLLKVNSQIASRQVAPGTNLRPGAYASSIRQRDQLRASDAASAPIAGSTGAWTPLGTTPENTSQTAFDQTNGSTLEGFVNVSGRISDFDRNPATGALYAAASNGGVWATTDQGASWHSIGEGLPSQVVTSIKYSPAGGAQGTLLVLTGDNAFGFDSLAGLGAYRSTDGGASWQHASGVPSGVLGFKLAVDPTDPNIVYAATGAGLFRSTDDGQSFTNVDLPTHEGSPSGSTTCTGHTLDFTNPAYKDCFLANEVTDVVVQGPANAQTAGANAHAGAVVAAIGWRAGEKTNDDGAMQSPDNGIFYSPSGAPGSFTHIDTAGSGLGGGYAGPGGGSQSALGRIALGIANGPAQNHQIIYALVEDANKFQGQAGADDLDSLPSGKPGSNVFNGLYASSDFGHTWHALEDANTLENDPSTGSALEPAGKGLSYEPGVQAWYNEWVLPDPTSATATGAPTRMWFGLEEVWENKGGNSSPQPLDGSSPTLFDVIGRYWNSCDFVLNGAPKCGPGHGNDNSQSNTTTTHPDQHGSFAYGDGQGGVTLVVGNDGGAYSQHAAAGQDFSNNNWGSGQQNGLHTLQAYDAEMSKDGTTYAGLQDNGQLKICGSKSPVDASDPCKANGQQYEIYGGDAFFTATDPNNSKVNYEEYTGGAMSVTTDGGQTWMNEAPSLVSAQFSTPFTMDPTDANHLMIGGRNIEETNSGPNTVSCADPSCSTVNDNWTQVYDLGTQKQPGDASAPDSSAPGGDPANPNNQLSAVALQGDNAYVGFCGYCDTITQPVTKATPFENGIATNVGGTQPPKRLTGQGWHIAKRQGLPHRYITGVAIDPNDPSTIYVSLAGYGRHWAVPGAVGDDTSRVGSGHVFMSTDAGDSFRDVSGDLPDTPVDTILLRNGQLIVGTDIGAFISSDTTSGQWAQLGGTLPTVPVNHLQIKPGDPNTLVAATYGRGVYTYSFLGTGSQLSGTNANPASATLRRGNACAAGARLTFRINPPRFHGRVRGRVVKVVVIVNGHRLLTRKAKRGRKITSVSFRRPTRGNLTVRIFSYNNRGGRVATTRRFLSCARRTKVTGKVRRHKHRRKVKTRRRG